MYQLILYFFLIVCLLYVFDCKGDTQNCMLDHGLGLKTLYNTQMYPQKMALEIMKSNCSFDIMLKSFSFLPRASFIKAVFFGCDFL